MAGKKMVLVISNNPLILTKLLMPEEPGQEIICAESLEQALKMYDARLPCLDLICFDPQTPLLASGPPNANAAEADKVLRYISQICGDKVVVVTDEPTQGEVKTVRPVDVARYIADFFNAPE